MQRVGESLAFRTIRKLDWFIRWIDLSEEIELGDIKILTGAQASLCE
jgi:hypothetical protein